MAERETDERQERMGWVVVIPQQSWTVCYGTFPDHDACCAWLRANGWHPSDAEIYPIKKPSGVQ